MILTIDVGNTNITCGVFQGDEIAASFRITTKMPRTSDEYGMMQSIRRVPEGIFSIA